jgi:hypothetical protein
MEYISLNKLINKYPTVGNYVTKVIGSIKLDGIYPTKNFIDFKISPVNNIKLDDIQSIDNTKFQFVLGVKNKSSETTPFKYFTSPDFFKKLQESINEPNPYFILQALKKEFIIEYSLEDDINILKDLSKLEADDSVTIKNHIWFLEDGRVDYKKLVQYIDWVVSTPTEMDATNLGVIPVSDILTKVDYEIKKLKLAELPKSEEVGGGSSSSGNNNNSGNGSELGLGSGGPAPQDPNAMGGYSGGGGSSASSGNQYDGSGGGGGGTSQPGDGGYSRGGDINNANYNPNNFNQDVFTGG